MPSALLAHDLDEVQRQDPANLTGAQRPGEQGHHQVDCSLLAAIGQDVAPTLGGDRAGVGQRAAYLLGEQLAGLAGAAHLAGDTLACQLTGGIRAWQCIE